MQFCGVLLLSSLSLVLGHLPSPPRQPAEDEPLPFEISSTPYVLPTSSPNQDADDAADDEVMGDCLLGRWPTASCMVKCFWKNEPAYCDEDANCRCGADHQEIDVDGSYQAPHHDFGLLQPLSDPEEGVMGVCYFGHIPSPSCLFRCSVSGQSAVCDNSSRCLCEERTWRELPTQTHSLDGLSDSGKELNQTESDNDDDGSIVFFIFDLGGLFDPLEVQDKEDPKQEVGTHELWTVPHFVALAVLSLVAILLILELTLCCKRRYGHPCKQDLLTVLTPEALEKGVNNEKHQ